MSIIQLITKASISHQNGFRFVPFTPYGLLEGLPVDVCSNGIITAAWQAANFETPLQSDSDRNLWVYNMTLPQEKLLRLYESSLIVNQIGEKYPSKLQIMPPSPPNNAKASFITRKVNDAYFFTMAVVIDCLALITFQRPG